MEENGYIPISADALKLSLSSHLLTLISGELSPIAEERLKDLLNSVMDPLYNGNEEDKVLMSYLNFISKFTDNHDLEAKTAQKMVEFADGPEIREFIATDTDEFLQLEQEKQFQFLFKFILGMGIDVEKSYKELDLIEAEANSIS